MVRYLERRGEAIGDGQSFDGGAEATAGELDEFLVAQPVDELTVTLKKIDVEALGHIVEVESVAGAKPQHDRLEKKRIVVQRLLSFDRASTGIDLLLP